MKKLFLAAILLFPLTLAEATAQQPADYSACILTPKAPDTPRINGPKVYGNRPGTPFLFKIPATGVRPMTFSAKGLPAGLKLDEKTGIIKGVVRRKGTWKVTLTAENSLGTDSRGLEIVIGDQLCLTPPMGWNSWNCWRISVSQEKVMSSVDALLEKGLDQYGWSYINIDDGWQLERGGAYNAIQPNDKFPDMKALADYIHSKGLKFGIYSSPWAMCPGGTIGSSSTFEDGHAWWVDKGKFGEYNIYKRNQEDDRFDNPWEAVRFHGDNLFMESDARQWADWGVDFLKYDWHPNDFFSIRTMNEALLATGRSIAYSISNRAPVGLGDVYVRHANAWRTSSDITDLWPNIYRIGFTVMDRWAAYTGPGHWPDADMLEIGAVADEARGVGFTRPCRLSPAEQYTHVTLWAILCSPLLIGCDLADMDDFTFSLLTNNEVIDVNQDPLGYPAARVHDDGKTVVYHKPMEDGSLVVALFNISDEPQMMGFQPGDLNYMMVEDQTVRDLWRQQDIAHLHIGYKSKGDRFETEVEPHGCRLLKLSPGFNPNQGMWWKDMAPRQETMDELKERVFAVASCQVKETDARLSDTELPRTVKNGKTYNSNYKHWCSGFFPGTAWYVYEVTGDEDIKGIAIRNTLKLADIPGTVDNHDIGFMLWCSYGNAFRITGDESYLPVIKAGSEKLATRFRPGAGIIQSWAPNEKKDWVCPVIIDNMMNLELLEEASKLFAEPVLDSIARSHANTTMNNHFRGNYSTYHVVDYDPESGEVRHKNTKQGYSDESSWGRGQAWALYGYTMMFRETRDPIYLEQAMKVSDFCISNLPEDGISYWDFDAPDIPDALRDASAAAVMASGLVELSTFVPCREKAAGYKAAAEKIIRELASARYMAASGENAGFLLKHSVGSIPDNSEIDVPLTYADYYFLEAIIRFCNN